MEINQIQYFFQNNVLVLLFICILFGKAIVFWN